MNLLIESKVNLYPDNTSKFVFLFTPKSPKGDLFRDITFHLDIGYWLFLNEKNKSVS